MKAITRVKHDFVYKIKFFVSSTYGEVLEKNISELADYFYQKCLLFLAVGFLIGSLAMFLTGIGIYYLCQYTGVI